MSSTYKDPIKTYEQLSSTYRKGPLKLLSSKYFLTCRIAIMCAFRGDLSREISDDDLNSAFAYVAETLSELDEELVPDRGSTTRVRSARLREICISNGYLFSAMRTHHASPTWRVTPDARRAFDATDALAEDQSSDFTSARFKAIMGQLERIEIDFTANRQQRAKMIQHQIDRLAKERDEVLAGSAEPISQKQAIDELETLYVLMRNLPNDVETVAYHVQKQTTSLTDELDNRTRTFAEMLRDFNIKTFDILSTSNEGRSYTDALRIMTTDEMDEITERLEQLEENPLVSGEIVPGYLSRAWDDMLKAIDHVQTNNREGSGIVVRCTKSAIARMDRSGIAKRTSALAALSKNPELANQIELPTPWQYPTLAYESLLVYQDESAFSHASLSTATRTPDPTLDAARLAVLAGPYRMARSRELTDATAGIADDAIVFVSQVLNSLPDSSRRLVEWAGLVEHLTKHGAVLGDDTTWDLVDVDGTKSKWTGPEIVIRKRDLVEASRTKQACVM